MKLLPKVKLRFYAQWDSLNLWKKLDWRDFTVIFLDFEKDPCPGFSVFLSLVGLNFELRISK
jgi:hypothetical protein